MISLFTFTFTPIEVLQKQFKVFGNFYNVEEQGTCNKYRNDLYIIDKDYYEKYGLFRPIKLLVIMMNPGESSPLSESEQIPLFTWEQVSSKEHCLDPIPTKPDRTQYQVMRLMQGLKIKHSRVINITDIRKTRSNSLAEHLESSQTDLHSIFSEAREQELQKIYSLLDADAFIFLAWGRTIIKCKPFKALVKKCKSSLPHDKMVLGVPGNSHLEYKHPLPRGRAGNPRSWLKEAEGCFNAYFNR